MNYKNLCTGTIGRFYYEKPSILIEKIERIRQELIKVANEKKSLTDEAVVKLSQELDVYLLECQKRN